MDYPAYNPLSPLLPLSQMELDSLDAVLHGLPADGAMTLDGVDGYLTALLVGPATLLATLPCADWMPPIWGGDGPQGAAEATPFASNRQRKATVVLVLRHLRHLSAVLGVTDATKVSPVVDTWEPIFSVAEQGAQEWVDARDWCAGFLQAVDLLPSAWDGLWDDPTLGPALAPLLLMGGGLDGPGLAHDDSDLDLARCDELSRAVPDAVLRVLAWSTRAAGAG